MTKRTVQKAIISVILILLAAVVLFTLGTFLNHRIRRSKELVLLTEKGYVNPVSVGDYSLNVAKFGNEAGAHTIVAMAGNYCAEYSVSMRQMTAPLEAENLVVFVDRAGYGLSDDTDNEMTLQYIVEDYRRALQNAGIEAPYILMPHSIGGAYATYWVSNYPEEIEAVVFVDGSELSATAFDDSPGSTVGFGDQALAVLAKMGFSRYAVRRYFYHLPDNYTEEEQALADALMYLTFEKLAPISEGGLLAKNAQDAFNGIVTNDVPKLYICASWGMETKEELLAYMAWINRQIEINDLNDAPLTTDRSEEEWNTMLAQFEQARQESLMPYLERLGNCEMVCLGGDHMIYEQKPSECAEIILDYLHGLDE